MSVASTLNLLAARSGAGLDQFQKGSRVVVPCQFLVLDPAAVVLLAQWLKRQKKSAGLVSSKRETQK